ncbi:hypothetical protein MAPG_07587 [Magnaporthiopsis poae ATCC 64411]|uniref:Uncharacterized protein n=1 Tax=Magnaporthiopsis poae (strain ATCC 64411 / 73-15) TaxID=644358 RepID=A0A0C4E529_MAGP6|nr:hypothetical protein MAPG_07587 [Magnaporthiopsis poae ATCC 64411]
MSWQMIEQDVVIPGKDKEARRRCRFAVRGNAQFVRKQPVNSLRAAEPGTWAFRDELPSSEPRPPVVKTCAALVPGTTPPS